jgi:uncharacterized membrane-anchored protein YhcB (DUF1043 family)
MNQNLILITYIIVLLGYIFYRYMWPQVKEVQQMIKEMQENKENPTDE